MSSFFIDRDLGPRVGRALRELKVDIVLHSDRFGPREPDLTWIPAVTESGLVILTRDAHIKSRPAERAVFEGCGARSFFVTGTKISALDSMRALLIAWPRILDLVEANPVGPFMHAVTRDGRLVQYIPVDGPAGPVARREALGKSRLRRRPRA